jgi:negative regulator of flagellin synthesis FlgM
MKGITGNPALDAYHRMGISPVGGTRSVDRPEASPSGRVADSSAAEVKISSRARDLAVESASQGVDSAKVEALRKQIAEGTYRSDPQAIAAKMIEQLA